MTFKRLFEFINNFAIAFEIPLPFHHHLKIIKKELNMSNYLSSTSISIYSQLQYILLIVYLACITFILSYQHVS